MTQTQSVAKAALWMAGWLGLMLVTAIAGRETTRELNVFQVMEMRSIIGFLMLLPLVRAAGGFAAMRTARPVGHLSRNVAHYAGQLAWLYALTLIPLAELVSIEFTMPFWSAILATLYLGERMNAAKIAAIALGIVGVAIIVRPGAGTIATGHWIMLAGAVGFGIAVVLVKSLTRTDSVVRIIFWMVVIQSAIGIVPALYVWKTPSLAVWPWVVVISFSGTFSHFCMARALAYADATVVVPMDFLRVPLTALIGWLLYAEQIDLFTAGGALLILLGNLLNLQRRSPPGTPAV